MAFSLSALDVWYLVREMRSLLADAFVDKVYQGGEGKKEFLFRLRSPKTGKQLLFLAPPNALFLTEHRFSWPQHPPGFCMQLRKHLTNAKVVTIEQHDFERVVELTFQKGLVSWKVVVELFSKGNVLLVNEEGLIRGVQDLQRWKDRTLRVNAPYAYPPGDKKTPWLTRESFHSLWAEANLDAVHFCAMTLRLGGKYGEEAIARAGIEKKRTVLTEEEEGRLFSAVRSLFEEELHPVMIEGDTAPFILSSWSEKEVKECSSFSEAIEKLVVSEKRIAANEEWMQGSHQAKNKWQKIIDEQQAKLEGYRRSAEEQQQKGEWLYEHYQEVSSLLQSLQEQHAKGGWLAVRSFIEEKKLPIKVDEQKGSITLQLKK